MGKILARSGVVAVVAVLVVFWYLFIKTTLILVGLLVIAAGAWGWWEIRELKKAMRAPPP